jgi:AraC-like DNA-binding protein
MSLTCRRLQEGQERIESIAASLGYESAPAFSRAFKRTLGVSPAGYRGGERT